MTFRRSKPALAAAALVALGNLGASCEGDVASDPTFRTWCGDQLCAWTTDAGAVRRAPTWHRDDHGVELLGTPASISQATDESAARCLVFTTVADVDASAQVTIGVDFGRDGSVDVEQPVAEAGFRRVRTEVTAPLAYEGVRFSITKKGEGRAVLAQIRVQSGGACTAPPVERKGEALGPACPPAGPGACEGAAPAAASNPEAGGAPCEVRFAGAGAEGGGFVDVRGGRCR